MPFQPYVLFGRIYVASVADELALAFLALCGVTSLVCFAVAAFCAYRDTPRARYHRRKRDNATSHFHVARFGLLRNQLARKR